MRCSTDLRQRVLGFVAGGGSKAEAARRFQVGIASVYRWVGAADGLAYRRPGPRGPRLDWETLRVQVQAHPDWTLSERAQALGASRNGVWHALQRLGIRHKKNARVLRTRSQKAPSLRALARAGTAARENPGLRG